MKYDDASWHFGGDYPEDLPDENGATHIGMFLAWCIAHKFFSEELEEDSAEDIKQIKSKAITGAEFLMNNCDGKFCSFDLSVLGQEFATDYYSESTEFAQKFASFIEDYCYVFDKKAADNGFEYETMYHVEDSWDNYNLLSPMIDERFKQWQQFKST